MSTKSPECWASDPQARGLRIEMSSERSLLLPFDQFLLAELITDGKEQRLRLVFATHEVLVRGQALRRILTAMQRNELSFITKLSADYRCRVAEGQPAILDIFVTSASPVEKLCDRTGD